jgi:hypothetical protein
VREGSVREKCERSVREVRERAERAGRDTNPNLQVVELQIDIAGHKTRKIDQRCIEIFRVVPEAIIRELNKSPSHRLPEVRMARSGRQRDKNAVVEDATTFISSSALRLHQRRLTFVRFAVFGCKYPVA